MLNESKNDIVLVGWSFLVKLGEITMIFLKRFERKFIPTTKCTQKFQFFTTGINYNEEHYNT